MLKKSLFFGLIFSGIIFANNAPKNYPSGELGKMVRLGEDILMNTNTYPLTKKLVGNKLKCINCHLRGADGKPGTG